MLLESSLPLEFLSTPSARRATRFASSFFGPVQFLSTPSARRATALYSSTISDRSLFLSTPSARRATFILDSKGPEDDISIHALREEGDSKNREKSLCFCFSILHLAQKGKCFIFAA